MRNRTNCYKSFIHHALAYITILGLFFSIALHCVSFLVLYCTVLLYSALLFVLLFDFQHSGYKFNNLNLKGHIALHKS